MDVDLASYVVVTQPFKVKNLAFYIYFSLLNCVFNFLVLLFLLMILNLWKAPQVFAFSFCICCFWSCISQRTTKWINLFFLIKIKHFWIVKYKYLYLSNSFQILLIESKCPLVLNFIIQKLNQSLCLYLLIYVNLWICVKKKVFVFISMDVVSVVHEVVRFCWINDSC